MHSMHYYTHKLQDPETIYGLAKDLFLAAAITCFLDASHRIARAMLLNARVKALHELEEAYEPEEAEALVAKVKSTSLCC